MQDKNDDKQADNVTVVQPPAPGTQQWDGPEKIDVTARSLIGVSQALMQARDNFNTLTTVENGGVQVTFPSMEKMLLGMHLLQTAIFTLSSMLTMAKELDTQKKSGKIN